MLSTTLVSYMFIFHICLDYFPLYPTGKKCVNNISSFVCNCENGYQRQGRECVAEQTCRTGQTFVLGLGCLPECDAGYKHDSQGSCVDYDECKHNPCPQGIRCKNTEGSFTCAGCKTGLTGTDCTDIDECAEGTHTCGPYATCFNLFGSFGCQCIEGFEKDGDGNCVEIVYDGKSFCLCPS